MKKCEISKEAVNEVFDVTYVDQNKKKMEPLDNDVRLRGIRSPLHIIDHHTTLHLVSLLFIVVPME